jgi:hypothetical protein
MSEDLSRPDAGNSSASPARSPMVDAFVGRQRELAILRSGLDDATSGRGRLFLVSGEPGIGKSRLAEEISREAAQRGMPVVWGRCWEGGGAPAYWPIIQVLRGCAELPDFAQVLEALGKGAVHISALVPELVDRAPTREYVTNAAGADPEQARFARCDALATLFKSLARREPMLLVLDDLHDADLATLQIVRFLAQGLRRVSILLIGTHREVEVERSSQLRSAIAALSRESDQIPLGGLSRREAGDLVRARTGIAPDEQFLATLHRSTRGNPLFLNGALQTLHAEGKLEHQDRLTAAELRLPLDLRAAILSRLERLSGASFAILSVAAAIGIVFDHVILERAARADSQEVLRSLDEAVNQGIVTPISGPPAIFRFSHALVRSAVYEGIGTMERARLHLQIAEALEEVYSADLSAHLAEIAQHFRLSLPVGAAQKAIDYSIRASEAAEAVYAYEDAVSEGEAALALMKQHGGNSQERAALLFRLARYLKTMDTRLGVDHYEAAIAAYDDLNLPIEAANARALVGQLFVGPGPLHDVSRALTHLRKAESVLRQGPPSGMLAYLYFGLAQAAETKYLVGETLANFTRALEVAEQSGDDGVWVWCISASAVALHQSACYGRIREARILLSRIWERLPAINFAGALWATIMQSGGLHHVRLDFAGAQAWYKRGLDSPLLDKPSRKSLCFYAGICCSHLGDIAGMRRHLADWRQFNEALRAEAEICLADAEGDLARGARLREDQIQSSAFRQSSHLVQCGPQFDLAVKLRLLGENAKAEQVLTSALKPCEGNEPLLYRELMFRPEHALNLIALGNLDSAQAETRRCAEILGSGEDWHGLKCLYHSAVGLCAAEAGDQAKGERHFAAAIEISRRLRLPWLEAGAFNLWGQALARAHQARSAVEKFDTETEILRRIGAGPAWIDRALAEKARATDARSLAAPSNAPNECALRREGEYWTLSCEGRTSRLKDAKGLHYVWYLLKHASQEIRAADLAALVAGVSAQPVETPAAGDFARSNSLAGDLGDAGEILDKKAKAAYGRRLAELREELEEARELGEHERAENAQAEIDALAHELKGAIGLGGRRRRAASSTERARIAVTRAIRLALAKIAENDPAMGKLLSTTIKTGTVCSYVPDDRFPVSWNL